MQKTKQNFLVKNLVFTSFTIFIFFLSLEIILNLDYFNVDKKIQFEMQMLQEKYGDQFTPLLESGVLENYFYNVPLSNIFERDKVYLWRLRPNNAELSINRKGYRGKEVSPQKGRNIFRIMVLGDSCTFGWLVGVSEAYPAQLEILLNNSLKNGKLFEVINAGAVGYTSFQGLQYLKKEMINYRPDMLIIFFGANDLTFNFFSDKELTARHLWIKNFDRYLSTFKFYRFFKLNMFKFFLKNKGLKTRVSIMDYLSNLDEFERLAKSNNIPLLYISPVWKHKGKLIKNGEFYKEPFVDIYSAFGRVVNLDKVIFPDNIHPTPFGHKIIAEEIYKKLIELKIVQ